MRHCILLQVRRFRLGVGGVGRCVVILSETRFLEFSWEFVDALMYRAVGGSRVVFLGKVRGEVSMTMNEILEGFEERITYDVEVLRIIFAG